MAAAASIPVSSTAPAGRAYNSIEHAGSCTLQQFFDSFPSTDQSFLAPPLFKTLYPEAYEKNTSIIKKNKRLLTRKEENKHTGIVINARGEDAEYSAFQIFERLLTKKNKIPILVLRNFELDKNRIIKKHALEAELGINLTYIYAKGEFDIVVIVKELGIVLIEIKVNLNNDKLDKAEKQLQYGERFFDALMSAFTGSPTTKLPVVKMVIAPGEMTPSPSSKSTDNTHIVHQDVTTKFDKKWDEVLKELHDLKTLNPFSKHEFERFTNIIMGVWCMEQFQRSYIFNNHDASLKNQLKCNDDMINYAVLSSDVRTEKNEQKKADQVTDVVYSKPEETLRTALGVNLIYLTPGQKNLYENIAQAIIRGPAGTGKTLLAILKIIDILQNNPIKNILILAPAPHHLRMKHILLSNGVHATVVEEFPPPASSGVTIMKLEHFFKVSKQTLASYDLSSHHLFVDDLQHLYLGGDVRYEDVANFIEATYTTSVQNDLLLWCAVDEVQSVYVDIDGENAISLFNIDSETRRKFTIPVFVLDKILRNSLEISKIVKHVRDARISARNLGSHVVSNTHTGHRIRSETVVYHKLRKGTDDKHRVPFLLERLREALEVMFTPPRTIGLNNSDVAILYDYDYIIVTAIKGLLVNTFHITPQTIEEHIVSGKDDSIILDVVENVMSFERTYVVYVRCVNRVGNNNLYNLCSRARTKLAVIDTATHAPPFTTRDVNMVEWTERNNTFHTT